MLWQPPLPDTYTKRSPDELAQAITMRKAELGDKLVILGHHYQQDAVIAFADYRGDSFKLSQLAAQRVREVGAKYVVFCGVHFMAESADVLAPEGTVVILPDMSAGCSMADMADYDEVVQAWHDIHEVLAEDRNTRYRVIPITYMNSTAAIKAFCGEHGGAVCTSSNADKILRWALHGGTQPKQPGEQIKVMFFPDQHLGRNTAEGLHFDVQRDMCLWDPKAVQGLGGVSEQTLCDSTFILWKGHCSVHKLFRAEHVDQIRVLWPDVKVMVHPECVREVVQKADLIGSTEGIIHTVEKAPAGSRWAVGTEVHLVNRLAQQAAQRGVTVRILSDCQCLCTTMYRIDAPHLLWVLDELVQGRVVNQVSVHEPVKGLAQRSLQRMLDITAQPELPVVYANTVTTSAPVGK